MIVNHTPRLNFNRRIDRGVVQDQARDRARDLTAIRPCNDNQRASSTSFRRARRPVLFCRWRTAPGGALECVWHTEVEAATAGEEPDICRLDETLPRSIGIAAFPAAIDVAGKLHRAVN